jgi:hypothetical protein
MAEKKNIVQKPLKGHFFSERNIKRAEEHYQAKFVDTFDLGYGPVDVFYNPNPDVSKGHSHYFALRQIVGNILISNGSKVLELPLIGLRADDGEIMFSRHRHDYRTSQDGTVSVDGGVDYFRTSIHNDSSGIPFNERLVKLKVVEDRIEVSAP